MSLTTPSKYQMIGHPLTDLITPFVHEHLFRLSGKNTIYDLYEISQNDFSEKIPSLMQSDGLCVAVPYKTEIIKYLDRLDEKASLSGCVNCVDTSNGSGRSSSTNCAKKKTGHNTECFGFTQSLESMGVTLSGKNVLLVGVGEYAKIVAIETILAASSLTIAASKVYLNNAELLREGLMDVDASAHIDVIDVSKASGEYSLIINASSIGMYPHIAECPLAESVLEHADFIYDFICNPPKTALLTLAESHNIKSSNGIPMLVWQAVGIHKYWYDAEFSDEDVKSLIEKTQAMVLTGFSESGSDRASKL